MFKPFKPFKTPTVLHRIAGRNKRKGVGTIGTF
jgi:hypothetical protein